MLHASRGVPFKMLSLLCLVVAAVLCGFPRVAGAVPLNGWSYENGQRYWYDNGVMARSKEVYDPGSDAWYWFDADGTMAHDKDVYLPQSDKWVRYDGNGHMIKGEDCRYGGWYYFDLVTGAMRKGFVFVPSNGGKWVYYDYINGQMHHGEAYIDGAFGDEPGWMLFDATTGAVQYGWRYVAASGGKWVYYDATTGRMYKGWHVVDGVNRYFDQVTGACTNPPAQGGSSQQPQAATVYVTPHGKKYHVAGCPSTDGSRLTSLSVAEAKARGYEPCKVCNPPRN